MYVRLTWKEGDAGDGRGDSSLQSADGVLSDLLGGDLWVERGEDVIENNECNRIETID